MIDLLGTDFQGRYDPGAAGANALPLFQSIPGVRGVWSSAIVNEVGSLMDCAFQSRTMAATGATAFASGGLVPYAVYGGANYHSRADEAGLDITSYLCLGGWYYITNLANTAPFGTKYTAAGNQIAYGLLYSSASNTYDFRISGNGVAVTILQSTITPFVGWVFAVGRYSPGATMDIWVSNTPAGARQQQLTQTTLAAGVPAAIFNSNAAYMIGGINGAASMIGRHWISFLSAAPVADSFIFNLFERTRPALGL